MAKVFICGYVGHVKLQFSDLTPFGGLITARLPGFKGSSVGYRVSAVMLCPVTL